MKKLMVLLMVVAMVVGVVGCGNEQQTATQETKKEETKKEVVKEEKQEEVKKAPGEKYKIGVSLPSPANQFIGAIIDYANIEAKKDSDEFDIKVVVSDNPAGQVAAIEDLMQDDLDAMVVLPLESAPLTPICENVYDAGVPLLVLDRGIASDKYNVFLAGDNYGIGRAAAHFIGKRLNGTGKVVEIMGVPCEIVTQRSEGFKNTIEEHYPDIEIVAQATGNFAREPSLKAMEDILQAQEQINAVYSHDDEQTLGIKIAVENAGRADEMFLTGAGGNKGVYEEMMNGSKLIAASFSYSPTMGGSAVNIAKKLAKGEGLTETLEKEVPRQIILNATAVTPENVEKFYDPDSKY